MSTPHVPGVGVTAPNRFSDAELAAEYWAAETRKWMIQSASYEAGCWDDVVVEHTVKESRALHRFATLPHYDVPQPWLRVKAPLRGVLHCPACGRFARVTPDGLPLCVRHGIQEVAFT